MLQTKDAARLKAPVDWIKRVLDDGPAAGLGLLDPISSNHYNDFRFAIYI